MANWNAFVDESMEKTAGLAQMKDIVLKARQAAATNPNLIKYPLIGAGGIIGWKQIEKAKRRYDIGSAYENAQGQ